MRAVVVADKRSTLEQLRKAVQVAGLQCQSNDQTTTELLAPRLAQGEIDVVLIAINGTASQQAIVMANNKRGLPVYAVGPTHDSDLIMSAMRSGARGYLDQEKIADELRGAISQLNSSLGDSAPGKTVGVFGVVPGTGTSTIAMNLSCCLGQRSRTTSYHFELADGVPFTAAALNFEPQHSIDELAKQWPRVDANMIQHAVHQGFPHLVVLARKPETLYAPPIPKEAARHFVRTAAQNFAVSTFDLGSRWSPEVLEVAQSVSRLVVVTQLDVRSLRQTKRVLDAIESDGVVEEKIKLVVNRYGQSGQVSTKAAEKLLGRKLASTLPDAIRAINKSMTVGRPVVQYFAYADFTRRLNNLAALMLQEMKCSV